MTNTDTKSPGLTLLGKLFVFAVIAASLYGAYVLFRGGAGGKSTAGTSGPGTDAATPPTQTNPTGPVTEIGIVYGSEKQRWLEWAAAEFAKTNAGRAYKINLIPKGSLAGAQEIWNGNKAVHVWSPASAVYRDVFVQTWQDKHGTDPIASEKPLAFTPMVFVMWDERYQAFLKKYPEVTFTTIAQAMQEPSGWGAIANQPDWMFFKFSHTHPNESNSGLLALILMAYDFHQKDRGLGGAEIIAPKFQEFMGQIEGALVRPTGQLVESTGFLMEDMVRKGYSSYDCVFVYENVAIDRLKSAEGRYGKIRVVYPKFNMWNDNPYYVLNVPWSTPEHRKGAQAFLDFLLGEPAQQQALLIHGFRPANTDVLSKTPDSPFERYKDSGLDNDFVGRMCEPVRAEVINNLLLRWQTRFGSR